MKPSDPSDRPEAEPEGNESGESAEFGRYATLGLQFAFTIAALTGLGWWLDTRWGTTPWCLVAGAILGFAAGFTNLVRAVPNPPSPPTSTPSSSKAPKKPDSSHRPPR